MSATTMKTDSFPADDYVEEQEAEPAEQESERKGTVYVILQARALGDDEVFVVITKREAANGNAAIRAHVNGLVKEEKAESGRFVAVPERSWDPQPVAIETSIKIG